MTHKKPVGMHLLSLPNIKSGFRVPSLTELTRRSRIEVPKVDYEKLSADEAAETSASIRARVQAARDIQTKRFSSNGSSDIVCNADMRVGEIRQFCKLTDEGQSLMRAATSCWHEPAQSVGAGVSLHAKRKTGAYDCGSGRV